jgi:D-threo-aldose 1-dehydrogenase
MGLGSAPLGNMFAPVAEAEADATVQRALDLGMRLFDTAPLYGFGIAEQRMGRVLARQPRDSFVLSTKVGRLLRVDAPPDPDYFHAGEPQFKDTPPVNPLYDYSRDGVLRSVEESLQRLGLDRIDILFIHDPDKHFAEVMAGAYPALDQLRSEGVVSAIGAGMNQTEMLASFAREGDFDCFLVAGRYTLLDQSALAELLPLCVKKRIAVVIGGVYNSGILADPRVGATFNYRPAVAERVHKAQRIQTVCERHGVPIKAAALQFPFGHPVVASVLNGARAAAELDENAHLFAHPIPADLWHELKAEDLLPEQAPTPT